MPTEGCSFPGRKTVFINLYGPPSAGKSGVAAEVYALLRKRKVSAELVREYAKYLKYAGREAQLRNEQLYLLAKQNHSQEVVNGKVDFAVTDSPLLLCSFYATYNGMDYAPSFHRFVLDLSARYHAVNFFLHPGPGTPFEVENRIHTERQAVEIEQKMLQFLRELQIPFAALTVGPDAGRRIVAHLEEQFSALRPECASDELS